MIELLKRISFELVKVLSVEKEEKSEKFGFLKYSQKAEKLKKELEKFYSSVYQEKPL